jgi:hypothetical protein
MPMRNGQRPLNISHKREKETKRSVKFDEKLMYGESSDYHEKESLPTYEEAIKVGEFDEDELHFETFE